MISMVNIDNTVDACIIFAAVVFAAVVAVVIAITVAVVDACCRIVAPITVA